VFAAPFAGPPDPKHAGFLHRIDQMHRQPSFALDFIAALNDGRRERNRIGEDLVLGQSFSLDVSFSARAPGSQAVHRWT
jgi:hypothetical protein